MAARLAIGTDARERLRRLAVVFAVELRMKIAVELYMRVMSAPQFYREFGGGSPTRINQNFSTLAKKNWLRLVRSEGPGGRRRGGIEHFYRATEPPFIDAEGWALLPYSVRATSSWNLFKQIAPRLRGDLEVSSNGARHRRDLSCTEVLLDEEGWKRAIAAHDAQFVGFFEEQEDARRRSDLNDEELIRADVFLIAFQSPDSGRLLAASGPLLLENPREPLFGFSERLAPILEDDVSLEIVSELNKREISVTQFHRELGGASKPAIGRRFKGLEGGGWAAKGKTKTGGTRRGATEQFYRATKPVIHGYDPGADAPSALKGTESWNTFERLCASIKEAMMSGTFDARADRYLAWLLISLDRQGWESVIAGIESLFEFISEEQRRATLRIAKSGEKPITMTLGLGAFEAMKDSIKAP
jgi:DNA-binding transcriptional ArsR family regulator